MTIGDHTTTFAGLEVRDFTPGTEVTANVAWRVRVDFEPDEPWSAVFESFCESNGAGNVRAFLVGNWGETASGTDSSEIVQALVAARQKLPKLEALFLGDIVMEEAE